MTIGFVLPVRSGFLQLQLLRGTVSPVGLPSVKGGRSVLTSEEVRRTRLEVGRPLPGYDLFGPSATCTNGTAAD